MSTRKYKGRTAGGILKTAVVAPSKAGDVQVWVKTPDGNTVIALVSERGNLVLNDIRGTVASLTMSDRAARLMARLDAQVVAQYKADGVI